MNDVSLDTVQALIANARRLGLTWTLTPGTVAPGAGDGSLVPVVVDGDDVAINTVSLVGAQGVGMRVMVLTVPPAGNYIIGYYGVATTRRALVYADTHVCDADLTLSTSDQVLSNCTHTFTITSPATLIVQGAIDFNETVGPGVSLCVGSLQLDGSLLIGFTSNMRVANDRQTPSHMYAVELDPGTYTVDMRARRTVAAGTQVALANDTTAMTVQLFQ
jgi:hypothetical protein